MSALTPCLQERMLAMALTARTQPPCLTCLSNPPANSYNCKNTTQSTFLRPLSSFCITTTLNNMRSYITVFLVLAAAAFHRTDAQVSPVCAFVCPVPACALTCQLRFHSVHVSFLYADMYLSLLFGSAAAWLQARSLFV